ncbi:bZIP transcription factor [Paenibacillus sp. Marseille-Q4541]|uniref:bZIP transcription factor n=1 Tax=Paenibacillus sp. Marseille-Q4541 TaxID=2831522 RepID=UPI001BA88CA2|nr:bZIP transcription factor [Paenibacillus sp. Marseille-Q4541]
MCFLFCHSRRLAARVHRLEEKVEELTAKVQLLQHRLSELESEVRSGLTVNPELQTFFDSKIGQNISISTNNVTVIGTVLASGVDAVEIRESNGDIVVIPYANISVAQ